MLDGARAEEEPLSDGPRVGAIGSGQDDIAFPGGQLAKISGGHHTRMPCLGGFPQVAGGQRVSAPMPASGPGPHTQS